MKLVGILLLSASTAWLAIGCKTAPGVHHRSAPIAASSAIGENAIDSPIREVTLAVEGTQPRQPVRHMAVKSPVDLIEQQERVIEQVEFIEPTPAQADASPTPNDQPTLPTPDAVTTPNGESAEPVKQPSVETQSDKEEQPYQIVPPLPPIATPVTTSGLSLDEVIQSVYTTYPLLQASITQREQAAGQHLSTWGEFDLKAKASTENKFLGYYENYRHKAGLSRNIYSHGGQWYSQYSLGRGEFEPWYKEREKNEGGEFELGLIQPLKQGRDIDARRAAIWRATYERQRVEPAIQRDLISFVFDGSLAYWEWVAAGQRTDLAKKLLDVAETRGSQIKRRVELGDLEKPIVTENNRLVLKRRGSLLDAQRKLDQAASKLSLFYRDANGNPLAVDPEAIPILTSFAFDVPSPVVDLETALASRPELFELNSERQKLQVTLSESQNNLLPTFDAYATAAQDVGGRASAKNDKQPLELETGFYFDVPVERRKARGKIVETQAKLAQLAAKARMTSDKIQVDLEVAAAAIEGAAGRVKAAEESVSLAEELVNNERRRFELGESSLLEVTIREQQFVESNEDLIAATLDLNVARAAYRASLGVDRL